MVTESIRQWNRIATDAEMAIGTHGPSGSDNLWRVMDILTDEPLLVYYPDGATYEVQSAEDWEQLPEQGAEIIVCDRAAWLAADEYLYKGQNPKYGLMLKEHDWRVIWHRAWGLVHERAAQVEKDRGD